MGPNNIISAKDTYNKSMKLACLTNHSVWKINVRIEFQEKSADILTDTIIWRYGNATN